MAIEPIRACGYRKVGGTYLVCDEIGVPCDRLPTPLEICPTCGHGVKFSRGFTWLDWLEFAGNHESCHCVAGPTCPVCNPELKIADLRHSDPMGEIRYGLIWIGEAFYTPDDYTKEALKLGVSRRISAIPRGIRIGETPVLLAHINACGDHKHGVFECFVPTRIEHLVWESQKNSAEAFELQKRGVTIVPIPDGDKDHDPRSKSIRDDVQNYSSISRIDDVLRKMRGN